MIRLLLALVAVQAHSEWTIQLTEGFFMGGINQKGQAVGSSYPAFKWDGKGLEKLPRDFNRAFGINSAGTVIGEGFDDHNIPLMFKDGAVYRLPLLGKSEGRALGVNSAGTVAGEVGPGYRGRPG